MKQFIIHADQLSAAVKKLAQAVPDKPATPIIDNLLAKKSGSELVLIGTDLELTIFYTCTCEGGEDFDFLIPFFDLKRIVAVEIGELNVRISEKNEVIITGVNDIFNLGVMQDINEFPNVTRLPKKNSTELNGTLIETLNDALLSVSKDEQRPSMCNILLDFNKKQLLVVSTDAYCLYQKLHNVEADFKEKLQISPKIAKALDGFTTTTIYFNEQSLAFESEQITIITKRHEGKYPNYKAAIPEAVWNASCSRLELEDALAKCCVVELEQNDAIISFGKEQFELESQATDTGKSAKTTIAGTYEGEVDKIAINAKKLLVSLSQLPEDVEKVRLSITPTSKAVLISPEADDSLLTLIMQISINSNN